MNTQSILWIRASFHDFFFAQTSIFRELIIHRRTFTFVIRAPPAPANVYDRRMMTTFAHLECHGSNQGAQYWSIVNGNNKKRFLLEIKFKTKVRHQCHAVREYSNRIVRRREDLEKLWDKIIKRNLNINSLNINIFIIRV